MKAYKYILIVGLGVLSLFASCSNTHNKQKNTKINDLANNINIKFEFNKSSFNPEKTKKEAKCKWESKVLPYLKKNNLIEEKVFFLINTTGGKTIYYNYACYNPTNKEIIIKVHLGANQNGWASEETHEESKKFEKNLENEGYKKIELE